MRLRNVCPFCKFCYEVYSIYFRFYNSNHFCEKQRPKTRTHGSSRPVLPAIDPPGAPVHLLSRRQGERGWSSTSRSTSPRRAGTALCLPCAWLAWRSPALLAGPACLSFSLDWTRGSGPDACGLAGTRKRAVPQARGTSGESTCLPALSTRPKSSTRSVRYELPQHSAARGTPRGRAGLGGGGQV